MFSSSKSWGGLEMNLVRWAIWLQGDGKSVVIFCRKGSKIHEQAKIGKIKCVLINGHRKYYDFKAGWNIYKLLKENSCSQVLFRDNRDMSTLALAKSFSRNSIKLFYFQGMQIGVSKRDIPHTIRFNKIDKWITPLDILKNEVLEKTRFSKERIEVMPLAISPSFVANVEREEVRKSLNVNPSDMLFGVIGRLDRGKCQDVFLEAFAQLSARDSSTKAILIGDVTENSKGNFHLELDRIVSENNLENRLTILPNQPAVANYINALDVLVMSSEAETFGMVTIEALWLGKVVIGTNSGGTPEILGRGSFGKLVEPKNVSSLTESMQEVKTNFAKYQTKAANAQKEALKIYSKTTFLNNLSKIMEFS